MSVIDLTGSNDSSFNTPMFSSNSNSFIDLTAEYDPCDHLSSLSSYSSQPLHSQSQPQTYSNNSTIHLKTSIWNDSQSTDIVDDYHVPTLSKFDQIVMCNKDFDKSVTCDNDGMRCENETLSDVYLCVKCGTKNVGRCSQQTRFDYIHRSNCTWDNI